MRLLIDKGIYDVLKPNWVTDSIALGHPRPFRKKYGSRYSDIPLLTKSARRYFFHASNARVEADGYLEGEATDDEDAPEASSSTKPVETETPVIKEEADVDMDPAMADWFKIDDKTLPEGDDSKLDDDSATDEDSDNLDVMEDAEDREEDDVDEWFSVKKPATKAEAFEASESTVKIPLYYVSCSVSHHWPVSGELRRRQDGGKRDCDGV